MAATQVLPRPKAYDDTFWKPISLWLTTTDHKLDGLRATDREGVPGQEPGRRLLGDEHHRLGHQRHHGLHQLPDHDRCPAGAGHEADPPATVRLGADLDLDPAPRRGRAARGGDDPGRGRPPAWYAVLHYPGPARPL